jgi:hypothetical protein
MKPSFLILVLAPQQLAAASKTENDRELGIVRCLLCMYEAREARRCF